MMIEVMVLYRDDKEKKFICNDLPYIGDKWLTLYFPLERKIIPTEAVAEINFKIKK